jgi:hypothetical protein
MAKIGDALYVHKEYFIHERMLLQDKLSRLRDININSLFDEVLKENEETILNMNRSQMYDEGVMDVNKPEQREKYSPATVKAKKRAAFPKTDFITLKWMGKFHEALKLIIFKDKFLISSDNRIWANFLEPNSRFTHALGLTKGNKNELRELSRDSLILKIREKL